MTDAPEPTPPDTPPSVVAEVESREPAPPAPVGAPPGGSPGRYQLGAGIGRTGTMRPYRRPIHDQDVPLYRTLTVFTSDPAASVVEGATAEVRVPYEPLAPGPVGAVFAVDGRDGDTGSTYRRADLDDPYVALRGGYPASIGDPRFHQQMAYAVATLVRTSFRRALGREPEWAFDAPPGEPARLVLRPFAMRGENACYDPSRREIRFGCYPAASDSRGRNLPGGTVFTCLSHDVVAHEVTHALLDGLRSHFLVPTNRDVLAFHEGFADLVAIFQRFSYEAVVRTALEQAGGDVSSALLTGLAGQFGQTTSLGGRWALRSALVRSTGDGEGGGATRYDQDLEEHAAGAVFLAAMFDAYSTIYRRKTRRIVQLVTGGGRRELGPEHLRPEVIDSLAEEAVALAGHFLTLSIRAVDYCPPVDLRLGEYLRALVTADRDVVPDDRWGYREALVDAFRTRGIYPRSVANLSEDALLWRPARIPGAGLGPVAIGSLVAAPANPEQRSRALVRAAHALGEYVTRPRHLDAFGLAEPGPSDDGMVLPPDVESLRPATRAGPDGNIVTDVVAEVVQRRRVGSGGFDFLGGSTIILSAEGEVRYAISKSVASAERMEDQRDFMTGRGARYWQGDGGGGMVPRADPMSRLHLAARPDEAAGSGGRGLRAAR